jgi:hypothetical protein
VTHRTESQLSRERNVGRSSVIIISVDLIPRLPHCLFFGAWVDGAGPGKIVIPLRLVDGKGENDGMWTTRVYV